MDAGRWRVIESIYHAALGKEPGERSAYLAAACEDDSTLRSEVESLLDYANAQLSSPVQPSKVAELLLNTTSFGSTTETEPIAAVATNSAQAWPFSIGRYRILRLIGEGGMGVVYEAEQEQPRRTVALKVIKPGLTSPELLRRFEQESEALGRLQHPGIGQIHEAGTADTGFGPQPYFAMEFIRGESLLEYAKARELNPRQRLELMAKVCEAVHHAHQRGIIHRDLKPGNILVDESGQPKVLDFGVARVTDSDTQATRQTDVGRLVGTLAYMSPEQVLADPLELDTRSDVYALGVILYELLAGRLPYTVGRSLPEAVQTIRQEDPARLSSISRHYRGDIETIVAKALEKDKVRRYASAAGLAGDIQRYLADEPIVARPPSATYQLQKFARRHKAVEG
jgi:non-specific serine/threonine protein kinase/serine/threonine-protein kinase